MGYGQRREFQIECLLQKPSIKLYTIPEPLYISDFRQIDRPSMSVFFGVQEVFFQCGKFDLFLVVT